MKLFCLISIFVFYPLFALADEWGSFNGTLINYHIVRDVQNVCDAIFIPHIDVHTTKDTVYTIRYPSYRTCEDGYRSIVKWMNENGK